MSFTRKLVYEVLRTIDSSTFTGAYQALGSPLANAASLIRMVNNSDVVVTISTDGVNDHDIAPAGSFWLYDIASDSPTMSDSVFAEKGRQYYVKGSAGTGSVYLVVQYVKQV